MKFYRNREIEARAEARLAQLEASFGRPLTPPISLDHIAEHFLGIDFLWEPINELPGETILGAICPKARQIILNEKHLPLFREKPGLERSTKGHEMGHWDLYLSEGLSEQPTLFEEASHPHLAYRSSPAGNLIVLRKLIRTPEGQALIRKLQSRADDPDEARAVNRYSSVLSMPRRLICQEALAVDRTKWSNLYRLAKRFDVTISALRVRLEQLDLLYVSEDGKTLYSSRAEADGQGTLF